MKPNYKFLTDIDLSSNIIANVSKIVGNDYADITPDLEITTEDSTTSGNLLLRAGSPSERQGGYVHIFAGDSNEPKETDGNGGIWVKPDKSIRVEDDKLQYYFSSVLEFYGDKTGVLDGGVDLYTKYNTKGSYNAWSPTEESADDSDIAGDKYTIRIKSDYFRLDTDYIDLNSTYYDLYSTSNINIHTASRTSGTLTLTSEKLESNHQNIVIDNAADFTQFTGSDYKVYVGNFAPGSTIKDPAIDSTDYLHLFLQSLPSDKSVGGLNESLSVAVKGKNYFEAKADLFKFDSTLSGGLFQIDTKHFDLYGRADIGITTPEFNLAGDDIHIRSNKSSSTGSLHLLDGAVGDEGKLKGIIIYKDTGNNKITLGTSNAVTSIPTAFSTINAAGGAGSVSTAFLSLYQSTIDCFATNSNFDINDYLKLKVENNNSATSSEFTGGVYSILSAKNIVRTDLEAASGSTTLDIKQGVVLFRTDSFMSNIRHNFEIKLDEDIPLDLYLDEYNTDTEITTGIESSTASSGLLSGKPYQRKFSVARETISGNRWNSKTGALEAVNNETAVVGRLDNLKVNKVFNMGMNEDKFSIYWDNYTSSLVFTQGEILWQ